MFTAVLCRALILAAVIAALTPAGAARAPVAFAGNPVIEHPVVRPNEDFQPDAGCSPEKYPGSGHCGSGNSVLDYVWIIGAGVGVIVLFTRLKD